MKMILAWRNRFFSRPRTAIWAARGGPERKERPDGDLLPLWLCLFLCLRSIQRPLFPQYLIDICIQQYVMTFSLLLWWWCFCGLSYPYLYWRFSAAFYSRLWFYTCPKGLELFLISVKSTKRHGNLSERELPLDLCTSAATASGNLWRASQDVKDSNSWRRWRRCRNKATLYTQWKRKMSDWQWIFEGIKRSLTVIGRISMEYREDVVWWARVMHFVGI